MCCTDANMRLFLFIAEALGRVIQNIYIYMYIRDNKGSATQQKLSTAKQSISEASKSTISS